MFEKVKLTDGKLLIPGVIDSTNNSIEHPELIASAFSDTLGWSAGRT